MKIGLVRRGYSSSGGAEQYLKRFAAALQARGGAPVLFASKEWPETDWAHGTPVRVRGRSPMAFAEELQRIHARHCDVLFSLERALACDVYRAGDGVHRAWLERRAPFEARWRSWLRGWNPKHREMLQLEDSLFGKRNAGCVIANSKLVAREITQWYDYPKERVTVVYNGLPDAAFVARPEMRAPLRESLGLKERDFLVFFAGSGWERKGLRFAVDAVRQSVPNATLVVAGRGNPQSYLGRQTQFLGPIPNVADWLEAADAFLLPTLYDPFSNATLEAFAAGLPVITSSANGFSELLREGETGSVAQEARDVAALAAALRHWSDRERREHARPRIRKEARAFTIEANLNATLAVLLRK